MCEAWGAWGASGAGEENPTISLINFLINFSIFAYIILFPANLIIKYKKHTLERGDGGDGKDEEDREDGEEEV